ncbi:MAG: kinase [Dokdonella sp.]
MTRNAITLNPASLPLAEHLLGLIRACLRAKKTPWLVGLSGLQGSGKSTLARHLVASAEHAHISALSLSLDDFYLGRAARRQLARSHPLFATRGVPGTHDIDLLRRTLERLRESSSAQPTPLPRFDKGRDTRLPRSRWRLHAKAPQLVLLEGWCVGVTAQTSAALRHPLNSLERDFDPDGSWRREVNCKLVAEYMPLWRRLDALVLLQAPDFGVVSQWRDQQEQALRDRHAPCAMDPQQLLHFLQHFERLSQHALATLQSRASIVIHLDPQRAVSGINAYPGRL